MVRQLSRRATRLFPLSVPMLRISSRQQLWCLLAFACIVRLLTLGAYPLTDTTEARYAEIARKMLETGQWIVPQIEYGVPFWGKPPLSFWLTAGSFRLFGINEFAARIPALLLGVAVCGLTYVLAASRRGTDFGLRASLVLATTLLMMASAGAVMTDPTMMLGTTLSMVSFWLAMTTQSRRWGYLFFVGLAIGLLAKGPVATVLTLGPIGAWALLSGRVRETWLRLPWLSGAVLTAGLVVPWYWAVEVRSPGFLHYFFIGEHWQRYTVSGWKGDLYGSGHAYPRGTIWLDALLATLPWSLWLLWQLIRRRVDIPIRPSLAGDGWGLYLVCWALAPAVFFTMCRNILPTYVLPGLVGFGCLVAEAWEQRISQRPSPWILQLSTWAPVLFALLVMVAWPRVGFQSQKEIVTACEASLTRRPLFILDQRRQYSADFYARGRIQHVDGDDQLRRVLAEHQIAYIGARRPTFDQLPEDLRAELTVVTTTYNGQYLLLRHAPNQSGIGAP
ncbi:4-amino-4-deoxy-L-arabinose transferase-like glycosyltransferase [Lysobacter niabensis]|uniref:4-amino-4-deoxy-L-arabinose transferase-like glycosyltransferase n=1 Tax=Agrilutibacter niabensis TaxID=380628 RepID=A0ABU1VMW5_9GAMM|nr:glycosyltransferase family 39 protein [Lysobacter niabensis]MDR7098809.1 4-amino-4-deoxy-L-arabinose transferase-like glycosyltransferase [Lysobacter niabensis]